MNSIIARNRVNELLSQYHLAANTHKREQTEFLHSKDKMLDAQEAQSILQTITKEIQEQAHKRIAGVVSKCLETVFDQPYEFKINFERKRGRTEANLLFERNGNEIDPMTASGGGVVDVAAFALRCACLILTRPQLRRVMLLDEPFKFVSEGYRERIRFMLEELAEDLEIQFIVVTHINELETGTIIRI